MTPAAYTICMIASEAVAEYFVYLRDEVNAGNPNYNFVDAYYDLIKLCDDPTHYCTQSMRVNLRKIGIALGHYIEVPVGEPYEFRYLHTRYKTHT